MVHPTRAQFDQIIEDQIGARLPGRPDQTPYEQSAAQNFRIGARKKEYDRIYRYGYTVAGLPAISATSAQGLVVDSNYHPWHTDHVAEDGFMGLLVDAGVARTVPIPIGQPYLDIVDVAIRPINYYQGGQIVVYDETPHWHNHQIIASELGTGTYVRLWLDHPIAVAAIPLYKADGTTRIDACAYRSPYSELAEAGSVEEGYESFVGIPMCGVVPALRYIWIMTAGPLWLSPGLGVQPGGVAGQWRRTVYAYPGNGGITDDPTAGFQEVGYCLGTSLAGSGDAKIMLQLDQ